MLTASCVCILLGALMILLGKLWGFRIDLTEEYRGRAAGVVAEIVAGTPDAAGIRAGIHDYYYPVIAYYANGLLYRETCSQGSNPCEFSLNEKVTVCYDIQDPRRFKIQQNEKYRVLSQALYYGGFFFCCLGGIFFLLFATRG